MTAKIQNQDSEVFAYEAIQLIDGDHPLKERVPGSYVEYEARIRPGGKVAYFNFRLAKEMGLVPEDHQNLMNPDLERILVETFGIIIINEYDVVHGLKIKDNMRKKKRYMATRYLQLQHPNKLGLYSGDGRSLWNGIHKDPKGRTWDITSCGTGATCLSPARAINNILYKSGDPSISYGCGYSELSEGIIDVLFSEIFNRNGIKAERTLAVIEFPGSFCVTVRSGLNLLRPSHFFSHLRQGQLERLRAMVDLYIEREVENHTWPELPSHEGRYDFFLNQIALGFADVCAKFESEYIFCWLDWDGDNILADGGVIDFGSVRQLGLYHHAYKFDDDGKWSTDIKGQKAKAKHIIASFAQIVDFLKNGKRKPHSKFKHHRIHKVFEQHFEHQKRFYLLRRIGFSDQHSRLLQSFCSKEIQNFEKYFYPLEAKLRNGSFQRVPDGKTKPAVYSMRELLRLLPAHLAKLPKPGPQPLPPEVLMEFMASRYAQNRDVKITLVMERRLNMLQRHYLALHQYLATHLQVNLIDVLKGTAERANILHKSQRITGDSICMVGEKLTKLRNKLDQSSYFQLFQQFLESQVLNPDDERGKHFKLSLVKGNIRPFLEDFEKILLQYREGL